MKQHIESEVIHYPTLSLRKESETKPMMDQEQSEAKLIMDQKQRASSKDPINPVNIPLVIAEYNAMREEILKHQDLQHQIIAIALIAPGTLLTIGFQTKIASIILVYPILSLFLCAMWLSNSHGVHRVGAYIKDQIESKVGIDNIGWEHSLRENIEPYLIIGFLGTRAIFIATELLTILAGISIAKFDMTEKWFLVIAIVSTILNIIMLFVAEIRRIRNKNFYLY